MCHSKPRPRKSLLQRVSNRLFRRKGEVPTELQQALQDCSALQELIALLFSTDYTMDEAMLGAFDQRIDELEQGTTTNVYHEFNIYLQTKKHGNRTL